ncbi:MAG: HAD family hydrolase [Planctomycetes bacterium]|nr:HAD family hydrolase [Planctomycetota bacterium]
MPVLSHVEFPREVAPRPELSHVLFDFDGTLSLIRQGWPEIMVPMFLEMLPPQAGMSREQDRELVFNDIMRLNGKQTIYQMMQLADRIRERGGEPREPLWYKHEYLRRLDEQIIGRKKGITDGTKTREQWIVHGGRALLEHLQSRGLTLYLASGTDEAAVKQEVELLGLASFFGRHIYGAQDDYKKFSKKMIIDRILQENKISGKQLLAFGDGYVEIENTKDVGGLAVAVASDEANNGSGQIDEWKRQRLLGVGADAVIPDYRSGVPLVDFLIGRG